MAKKTGFLTWIDSRVKRLDVWDMALIKIGVAGFVLTVAKLWQPLLSLYWYWYAAIFVVAAARPALKIFGK